MSTKAPAAGGLPRRDVPAALQRYVPGQLPRRQQRTQVGRTNRLQDEAALATQIQKVFIDEDAEGEKLSVAARMDRTGYFSSVDGAKLRERTAAKTRTLREAWASSAGRGGGGGNNGDDGESTDNEIPPGSGAGTQKQRAAGQQLAGSAGGSDGMRRRGVLPPATPPPTPPRAGIAFQAALVEAEMHPAVAALIGDNLHGKGNRYGGEENFFMRHGEDPAYTPPQGSAHDTYPTLPFILSNKALAVGSAGGGLEYNDPVADPQYARSCVVSHQRLRQARERAQSKGQNGGDGGGSKRSSRSSAPATPQAAAGATPSAERSAYEAQTSGEQRQLSRGGDEGCESASVGSAAAAPHQTYAQQQQEQHQQQQPRSESNGSADILVVEPGFGQRSVTAPPPPPPTQQLQQQQYHYHQQPDAEEEHEQRQISDEEYEARYQAWVREQEWQQQQQMEDSGYAAAAVGGSATPAASAGAGSNPNYTCNDNGSNRSPPQQQQQQLEEGSRRASEASGAAPSSAYRNNNSGGVSPAPSSSSAGAAAMVQKSTSGHNSAKGDARNSNAGNTNSGGAGNSSGNARYPLPLAARRPPRERWVDSFTPSVDPYKVEPFKGRCGYSDVRLTYHRVQADPRSAMYPTPEEQWSSVSHHPLQTPTTWQQHRNGRQRYD